MADVGSTALAITAVGQSMAAYSFMLPPLHKVRRENTQSNQNDVHLGLIAAASISLGSAFILANLAGNNTPIHVALVIAIIIGGVYEYAACGKGVLARV